MKAETFFTEPEKERIRQAVVAAETKTAGEIVPMITSASARYTEVEMLGLVCGLFIGMIVEWLWGDPWDSHYFQLWPVVGALAGFLIGRVSWVKRMVISRVRSGEAVHMLSLAVFTEQGLHYTREHTGILILVSLLEHRVEVLADRGINQKVAAGTWDEIVHILTRGIKEGQACDAFCRAIERCGDILATHFPRQADDKDELPNRLVTR